MMEEKNVLKTGLAEVYVEQGIFHISMIILEPTIADYRQHFVAVKAHFGNILPLPAILRNPEHAKPPNKEMRDFLAGREMLEIVSALGIINNSSIMRLTANLFFKISKPTYPMQMFADVEKAEKWLRSLSK
jgi:hypothetical protein